MSDNIKRQAARDAAFLALVMDGLTLSDCLRAFSALPGTDAQRYVDAARAYHASDELEIADEGVVSEGDDPGAFVLAWVWVTDVEAGVTVEEGIDPAA